MSLTQCDRVARCEESCNHEGPCSFHAPFATLVEEIDKWVDDKMIQQRYSLEDWIKEELRAAKEFLAT